MELQQSVTLLEREANDLERQCAAREGPLRVRVDAARADLLAVQTAITLEEARLSQFEAEEKAAPQPPVMTVSRSVFGALCIGAYTWGAAAANIDMPHAIVGLVGGVWLAFLVGVLRGK